jgi:hypothetical protein
MWDKFGDWTFFKILFFEQKQLCRSINAKESAFSSKYFYGLPQCGQSLIGNFFFGGVGNCRPNIPLHAPLFPALFPAFASSPSTFKIGKDKRRKSG